jgi:hypothetical protein
VDPFTLPGNPQSAGITATANVNDIESELGRLTVV